MVVRSDRLAGPTNIGLLAVQAVFTVPAGETYLVKRVVSYCGAGVGNHRFYWRVFLGGVTQRVYSPLIGPGEADDHDTWWALDPGAQLQFESSTSIGVWSCYGAKLLGAAA